MFGKREVTMKSLVLLLASMTVGTIGCGKADYEAAMKSRIQGLAFESKFIELLQRDSTEVIKGVAELRLPVFIDQDAVSMTVGKKTRQGVPIDPRRIQPPGIAIPGFRYSYETFVDMGGKNNTHPLYTYFGSVPGSQPQKQVLNAILKGARSISRKATWQDVPLDTPDRQKLNFKKLVVEGVQDFEMDAKGGEMSKKPGKLEIYVHSTKEFHVIVGFRGTDDAAAKVNMFDAAPVAMGTLTIEAAEADEADA